MSEKAQVTSTLASDGQEIDRTSFEKDPRTNQEPLTTTTALLQEDDSHVEAESAFRRPDKNLTAAIWAIVCGVALPCESVAESIAYLLCADIDFQAFPSSSSRQS